MTGRFGSVSISTLAALIIVVFGSNIVGAEGNYAKRANRLPELKLDAVKGFSVKSYDVETGQYYRWRITSDGKEEYKLLAPELFRNSWINQVSIENKEVKPTGLYAIEFDDEGTIDIWFIPLRPGTYEYYIDGLANDGFKGSFVAK